MRNNNFMIVLFGVFVMFLGLTFYTGIDIMAEEQEVVLQKITIVYDENSGVVVNNSAVTFNDKNQTASMKALIKNNQDFDIKMTDIKLSTPTEEFLKYKVETLDSYILKANSEKEIVFSLETTGIKGWGRNFSDQLTANVSFEKATEEITNTPKEEPEQPAANTEELIAQTEKIEVASITTNSIEFTKDFEVNKGEKIAVWLYSKPIFLGYFDIIEINGTKQITGLEAALQKLEVEAGEHNLALVTEAGETIGYINVYIDENKEILEEKKDNISNDREENIKEEDVYQDVENPNTGEKTLFIVLIFATFTTAFCIILASRNTITKYSMFFILLNITITLANAETLFNLPISFSVNFESQNVMDKSYVIDESGTPVFHNYWKYAANFKNVYINDKFIEVEDYIERFDASEAENGRVMAYVVNNNENTTCKDLEGNQIECYDLYLMADGLIYFNNDAAWYFDDMINLDSIDNIETIDTSNVSNMRSMFNQTGYNSSNFKLDVSNFDTSNVIDISNMFFQTGYNSLEFTLDVSGFDTSKAVDMSNMFNQAGYSSKVFQIDVSGFDTSSATNMGYMFKQVGYSNPEFTLDVTGFETSNVYKMNGMFYQTGYINPSFTLDVSNFDTSEVTDMSNMFSGTGYNSLIFTLDVSNFDTSEVTDMSAMFFQSGFNSEVFELDVSGFNTSKVTNMSSLFNRTGYNTPGFTLDVSNFDTSEVTDMSNMFNKTGYSSTEFELDITNFDTSKVTTAAAMFYQTGYNNPEFVLDLKNFDTSSLVNMNSMFNQTGYNSSKWQTSITIKNSNVISFEKMFERTAVTDGSRIKVNYVGEIKDIVLQMLATSTSANVVVGNLIVDVNNLDIGDEIHISGEEFNVISQNDDTITVLAKYNLGGNYRQSTKAHTLPFSNGTGWDYKPGPKEIDIQTWSTNPKVYVNNYVQYLSEELNSSLVSGDLISLKQLESLGCVINDDYSWGTDENYRTCKNSEHKSWLITSQYWLTKSAIVEYANNIWTVGINENLGRCSNTNTKMGIRPVITIPKSVL